MQQKRGAVDAGGRDSTEIYAPDSARLQGLEGAPAIWAVPSLLERVVRHGMELAPLTSYRAVGFLARFPGAQ